MGPPKKWTANDELQIIKLVYQLRLDDPEPSLLQIIKMVNDSLPADKKKNIISNKQVPEIIEGVKELYKCVAGAPSGGVVREIAQLPLVAVEQLPAVIVEPDNELRSLTDRLTALTDRFDSYAEKMTARVATLEEKLKTRRLRVGVGGLKPEQFHTLSKDVREQAELIELDRDQNRTKIPANLDYVLLTRFVSHQFNNQVAKEYTPIMVDGGLSLMRQEILGLVNRR